MRILGQTGTILFEKPHYLGTLLVLKCSKQEKRDERNVALISALLLLGVQKWPKRSRLSPLLMVPPGRPRQTAARAANLS